MHEEISKIMNKYKVTQTELSAELNIHSPSLSRSLSGKHKLPKSSVRKIMQALIEISNKREDEAIDLRFASHKLLMNMSQSNRISDV